MSLLAFYQEQSKYYGPWVARAETVTRMKANLLPQTHYRRATIRAAVAQQWREIHAYGAHISAAMGMRDYRSLLEMYNSNFMPSGSAMGSSKLRKLKEKVRDLRDASGESAFFMCGCCDQLGIRSECVTGLDGYHFCAECVSRGRTRFSRVMGGYISRAGSYNAFTSREDVDNGIRDAITSDYAREHRYHYDDGVYYAPGVFDMSSRLNNTLFSYHSGPDMGHIPSAYDSRKPRILLGMELEMEISGGSCGGDDDEDEDTCSDRASYAKRVVRALNGVTPAFCKAETDGSLDDGFEIISGYTGLDVHEKTWKALSRATDGLESHDTDTCGLHVHVDKAGMTPLHMAKLCTFIHAKENQRLLTTISRRYQGSTGSGYAKFYQGTDWVHRAADAALYEYKAHRMSRRKGDKFNYGRFANSEFWGERYAALNFNNAHTVEFRMFRGTLKFESIMACLEFAFASWHFTKETPMKKLTTEAFMDFICRADNRKDTKYLRAYLKAKKFRAFYQSEQVARPKFKAAAPSEREEYLVMYDDAHNVRLSEPRQAVAA